MRLIRTFQSQVNREVRCASTLRKCLLCKGLEGTFAHAPAVFGDVAVKKFSVRFIYCHNSLLGNTLQICPPYGKDRQYRKALEHLQGRFVNRPISRLGGVCRRADFRACKRNA